MWGRHFRDTIAKTIIPMQKQINFRLLDAYKLFKILLHYLYVLYLRRIQKKYVKEIEAMIYMNLCETIKKKG